ncbi:hypothetical protein M231_01667 [Tremella mesenterica]|uniref:Uncharacterized protein n=1 Tax=Tremella mesenterica TaxID=5217 RepID=A0A4Q1BST6_TREME|nr:hypothetical protein M231_01667 [Tremella mesenterica]
MLGLILSKDLNILLSDFRRNPYTPSYAIPDPISPSIREAAQSIGPNWGYKTCEKVFDFDGGWVEEIDEIRRIAYHEPKEEQDKLRWFMGYRKACQIILSALPPAIAELPGVQCDLGLESRVMYDLKLVVLALEELMDRIKTVTEGGKVNMSDEEIAEAALYHGGFNEDYDG